MGQSLAHDLPSGEMRLPGTDFGMNCAQVFSQSPTCWPHLLVLSSFRPVIWNERVRQTQKAQFAARRFIGRRQHLISRVPNGSQCAAKFTVTRRFGPIGADDGRATRLILTPAPIPTSPRHPHDTKTVPWLRL